LSQKISKSSFVIIQIQKLSNQEDERINLEL
jgi:hypothetical protein